MKTKTLIEHLEKDLEMLNDGSWQPDEDSINASLDNLNDLKIQIKKDKLKAQLDVLKNFYYGKDLKDKDILNFYEDAYDLVKTELKRKLRKLKEKKI